MKIRQFFAVMTAAVLVASCSNGSDNNGGTEPEPSGLGQPTYATFNFNLPGNKSKVAADYDPFTPVEDDIKDAKINISDLRLIIFNATTGAVEYNKMVTATSQTILLTSGNKKIFVVANAAKLKDGNGGAGNFNTDIAAFTVGSSKTLSDFNNLKFSAGTPQNLTVDKDTDPRTFDITPLHTIVEDGVRGLPMSNSNAIEYILKDGVTESDANDAGTTPSNNGVSQKNRFNIQLDYMTAKARLSLDANVAAPSNAKISNVKYTIKNLARLSYYTQHVVAGVPQSYYHSMYDGSTPQATFDTDFDYATNVNKAVAIGGTGAYISVPENTNSVIRRGQSSYYAINAKFEPKKVVKTVDQNLSFQLVTTIDELANIGALGAEGAMDYYFTTIDIEGIPAGSYYKNLNLLRKAAWITKHGIARNENWTASVAQNAEADAIMAAAKTANGGKDPYRIFFNAQSWYRLDIGEGSGVNTEYGVLRGNKYTATIDKITGPGLPSEGDLTEEPEKPVKSYTYINATIKAAIWTPKAQTGSLN